MSRRDRFNRGNERPDFQEVRHGGTEGKSAPTTVVIDPDDAEEGDSFLQKMGAFFGGCWGKIASFSKVAVSKLWGWGKFAALWTWGIVKTIPAYCTLRWNSEEDENADDATDSANAVTIYDSKIAPAQPVNKPTTASASEYDEEDDLAPSRWWSIGIKSAAAAAVALILVGGYFGATSLLNAPTEIAGAPDSIADELDEQTALAETADGRLPEGSWQTAAEVAAAPEPAAPAAPAGMPVAENPAIAAAPVTRSFAPPGQNRTPVSEPKPEPQPEPGRQSELQAPAPSQESFLADPFFAAPVAPAVAETTPSFGAAVSIPADPPTPVIAEVATMESVPEISPSLTTLQPLAPLDLETEPVPSAPAAAPQLQPLVALDASALPQLEMAAAAPAAPVPVAMEAPASPQVAANIRDNRQAQRNTNISRGTTQTPSPPPVTNTIPPTTVQQSVPITEPIREIIPQIPSSGTIQDVPPPPPPSPPPPPVAQMPVVQPVPSMAVASVTPTVLSPTDFMIPNESAPAIPKDVSATSPVVSVPPPTLPAHPIPSASQPLPAGAMLVDMTPMDRQLWDHVRELRGETTAEPTQLRFNAPATAATTAEPALRFTPKQTAASVQEDNPLAREAMNSFGSLLPSDDLSPANLKEIEKAFSAMDAPKPVYAEPQPKYRDGASGQAIGDPSRAGEGGLTFQSRINSQISRSPQATERYIVQQGDTYMTISDKFYGTSLLYSALARHNQTLGIGWRPAEGVAIEIPTADYLRTHYSDGGMANRQRQVESQQSAVRYIVQEGDTIFRLATDKLRDSTRWREIYALNMDRLQDVRDLKPGMEILLPVETARVNRQQTY